MKSAIQERCNHGLSMKTVLMSQGIKARKRFQLRNKYMGLSVTYKRVVDSKKQKMLITPSMSVSPKRPVCFNCLIME